MASIAVPETIGGGFFESLLLDSIKEALAQIAGDQGRKALIYHLGLHGELTVPMVHARLRELLGTQGATIVEKLVVEQFQRTLETPCEDSIESDFESRLLRAAVEFSRIRLLAHNIRPRF